MHTKPFGSVGRWMAVGKLRTISRETKRFQIEKVRANIPEAG